VDLGQVYADQLVEHPAHVERQRIGRARLLSWCRQRGGRRRGRRAKARQRALNGPITLVDGLLIPVVELERLPESEYMLLPVVADKRVSDRLDARLATRVAMLCKLRRVMVAGDDGAHDAHARLARDVGDDW